MRLRWWLICEDREQERFFRRLGERKLGGRPLEVIKPPRGEGAAWGWVLKQYPAYIKKVRRYPGERVALMVVVDGDNEGFQRRKRRFDEELTSAGEPLRSAADRIALCVPTWSIETWMVWLCDLTPLVNGLGEHQSFKAQVQKEMDARPEKWDLAVAKFSGLAPGSSTPLPSLDDAQEEIVRLGQ